MTRTICTNAGQLFTIRVRKGRRGFYRVRRAWPGSNLWVWLFIANNGWPIGRGWPYKRKSDAIRGARRHHKQVSACPTEPRIEVVK